MGNKKTKFTQLIAVAHFLIFQMQFRQISNDCKSSVSAHQSCTIEVFRLENYRNIAILGSVLHTLLKLKNKGICFKFFFKNIERFESDACGDRKLFFFGLRQPN